MAKRLFLLLFSSFIGIFGSPEFLTASDSFVASTPEFNAVETIVEPEPEPAQEVAPVVINYTAPAAGYQPAAPQTKNYTVTIFTDKMIAENLSYNDIYKFRKLVYGHNSGNLLGNLGSLAVGEVFTIAEGGVAKSYRVADKVTYRKTADGNLENDSSLMRKIAYSAMGHSVALMTCAGQPLGGGDATHRLVVYADAI
ncbi:hypothetical protein IKF43_01915 [Candidatus Saccharibacteria bacterium]|nr:hypothetical protein [Candidatus Saccharibacteria bacterium]